jgi:sulfhydrogenase subunit alpha
MSEIERKQIQIPEISRVEGHSAVTVDIKDGHVLDVKLEVFEGTRFFEKIVVGHKYDEMPHITSRVCAICSTGHVIASLRAIEQIFNFQPSAKANLFRELMHLGMIIESHATHICALALPDFLKTPDLLQFASEHPKEFELWTRLRNLGASIQTVIGGRPFHPVNLHPGGLSRYPSSTELKPLLLKLDEGRDLALRLHDILAELSMPIERTTDPCYLALIPDGEKYGFFGTRVRASDGWEAPVDKYQEYLSERVVAYSHAKQSVSSGKPFMVGSMARLFFFGDRLGRQARILFEQSPLARGKTCTLLNNLAQAIEIVEAIERAMEVIGILSDQHFTAETLPNMEPYVKAGRGTGAVECPRGTLYHYYELDDKGTILSADMITPSAQNTARIELDIRSVVEQQMDEEPALLQTNLETLVRAYDPCNTCATHMVQVRR